MSTLSGSSYYKMQQAFQSSINYNIGSYDMFSTGATPGKAHIIEILDINNDDCENTDITLTPVNITYLTSTMNVGDISHNITTGNLPFANWTQNTSSNYPLVMDVECLTEFDGDKKNAFFVEALIKEKKLVNAHIYKNGNPNSASVITTNNNEFVCVKFIGECLFQVYNAFGSLIVEGKTENCKINYLNSLTPGTYIIKVTDDNGNISSDRIIITK